MSVLTEARPLEHADTAQPSQQCQVEMWFHDCANRATWLVTRHDCPSRWLGHWRARRMLKAVGPDRIIRPGGKSRRACSDCRSELQTMFAFGAVRCWGCLRAFSTYDDYYPAEVEL